MGQSIYTGMPKGWNEQPPDTYGAHRQTWRAGRSTGCTTFRATLRFTLNKLTCRPRDYILFIV